MTFSKKFNSRVQTLKFIKYSSKLKNTRTVREHTVFVDKK